MKESYKQSRNPVFSCIPLKKGSSVETSVKDFALCAVVWYRIELAQTCSRATNIGFDKERDVSIFSLFALQNSQM